MIGDVTMSGYPSGVQERNKMLYESPAKVFFLINMAGMLVKLKSLGNINKKVEKTLPQPGDQTKQMTS